MSCLYCVSAHRHGRFWFCNRCGKLMFLRPLPAQEIPTAPRPPEGRRVHAESAPGSLRDHSPGEPDVAGTAWPCRLVRIHPSVSDELPAEPPSANPAKVAGERGQLDRPEQDSRVSRRDTGATSTRRPNPNRQHDQVAAARSPVVPRHPVELDHGTAAAPGAPGPLEADVPLAVVLDLDAARWVKHRRAL